MHELEALERRGWEALSGADGAAFYADLMADDGLMVFPRMVLDKAQTVRAIAAESPWSEFELADIRIVHITPDAAFLTYRARARREGEAEYAAVMTSAYARREGRWRLVLHQQSPG